MGCWNQVFGIDEASRCKCVWGGELVGSCYIIRPTVVFSPRLSMIATALATSAFVGSP